MHARIHVAICMCPSYYMVPIEDLIASLADITELDVSRWTHYAIETHLHNFHNYKKKQLPATVAQ